MNARFIPAKGALYMPVHILLGVVFFGVWVQPVGVQAQSSPDQQQIEQLIGEYAKSIDAADTALAARIWSRSPEVSFIHPRGHEHGFGEVKQNFYVRTMGDNFSERKLTTKDIHIHIYGDSAWAEFYWDFAAKLKKNGSLLNTAGRETQIYRREPGGWRLVHVHYSGMPVSGERRGF